MRPFLFAAALIATPVAALAIPTMKPAPGDPGGVPIDLSAIESGTYSTDPAHTLVGWRVNHFGFNDYFGLFGDVEGTLQLDKDNLANSSVSVTVPISSLSVVSEELATHMMKDDFFHDEEFPTATFKSTGIEMTGATTADISGDLTLNGNTRPVTLIASFTGSGANPMSQKQTLGFEATALINRSEFGMDFGIPNVSDEVALEITVAFEK